MRASAERRTRITPSLGLLRRPLIVLLEEQAIGLTPLLGHVLGEGRRVCRRCDLTGDHLNLRRVEPVEPDIERHEVLELRRGVLRAPGEELARVGPRWPPDRSGRRPAARRSLRSRRRVAPVCRNLMKSAATAFWSSLAHDVTARVCEVEASWSLNGPHRWREVSSDPCCRRQCSPRTRRAQNRR